MIVVKSAKTMNDVEARMTFDIGFYGDVIDQRTEYSSSFIQRSSKIAFCILYELDNLCLLVNGDRVQCEEFPNFISQLEFESIIVDSTSLGVPELALLLKAINSYKNEFLVLYVEPEDYDSNKESLVETEEFKLSDNIKGFESAGIPTIYQSLDSQQERRFVFFLGFEEGRLMNALETFDVSENEAKIIFGVPAFQPGWEERSIKRNLQALRNFELSGRVGFCGANSVESALNILRSFAEKNQGKQINLVPIGTKPHALSALLFLIENPNANLLFDQPKKKKGRSRGVGEKHLYKVSISA